MDNRAYGLVVLGSGPAGQKAAVCAAKLGVKVAIVDRHDSLGGVSLHTGTIPSKTLREAILYLSGFRQRALYGKDLSGQGADLGGRPGPARAAGAGP